MSKNNNALQQLMHSSPRVFIRNTLKNSQKFRFQNYHVYLLYLYYQIEIIEVNDLEKQIIFKKI